MGEKLKFWIGFNRTQGIGPVRLRALLDRFGDIERAWNATPAELRSCGLDRKSVAALLENRRSLDLDRAVARVERGGIQVLTWGDSEYPDRLREIPAPPPVLYVKGRYVEADRWAVALVGTRQPTPYGRAVAQELGASLATAGVTVISGLARGVDGLAHGAALDSGGRTIAVFGSGLDRVYPPEHRRLADAIGQAGVLMSDYPLGTAPEPGNFPPRNRIISGLSLAVVVIEAGERSGALITAGFAADQGRETFALPGPITSPASAGTNRLIRDGATPLLSVDDVLESLDLEVAARREAMRKALPQDPVERSVLGALSAHPTHVDEIRAELSLPAAKVAASLALLELKGLAMSVGGMRYVRSVSIPDPAEDQGPS